jgi:predicted nucleic acid-binding protein
MKKLYVDSCIFLNVWFEENIGMGEAFYKSKKILEEVIECNFQLYISKLTLSELSKKLDTTQDILLRDLLLPFQILGKLKLVKVNRKVAEDAAYFSGMYGIHKADALHAMLASTNNCILVTRDRELYHAANIYGTKCKFPEEIIPQVLL